MLGALNDLAINEGVPINGADYSDPTLAAALTGTCAVSGTLTDAGGVEPIDAAITGTCAVSGTLANAGSSPGRPTSGFGRPESGFGRPESGFGVPASGWDRPTRGW